MNVFCSVHWAFTREGFRVFKKLKKMYKFCFQNFVRPQNHFKNPQNIRRKYNYNTFLYW